MRKLEKRNIQDILALTPMQEGMLYHYLMDPSSGVYFEQLCLNLCGKINIKRFRQAWNIVIEANDMLRVVFFWEKMKDPIQVVLKNHHLEPEYYDLSTGPGDKPELLEKIKTRDKQEKFDLEKVPFRVKLCKIDEDKHVMIISYHHILFDGWSTGIILGEFFQAYEEWGKERRQLKPPVKAKFKEFIKVIGSRDVQKEEKFWRDYLKGFDAPTGLSIKRQSKGKTAAAAQVETHSLQLESDLKKEMEDFVKKHKITLAGLLYTSWAVLLQKYSNSSAVIFGTTVSGRSVQVKGIENTVGLFINTLPLPVNTDGHETTAELLYRIDDSLRTRDLYQHTSLVNIKEWSEIDSKQELFDCIIAIENYPLHHRVPGETGMLSLQSYTMAEESHYDLTVTITTHQHEDIRVNFSYKTDCCDKKSILGLAGHFSRIIRDIIAAPGKKVSAVEMLEKQEKRRLLLDFNDTTREYPRDKTIHELFEEQMEQIPDHIALVGKVTAFGAMQLTYRQVNESTNQLAHRLKEKGMGPDTIVGIIGDRSLQMIIGVLGILKSGGAYLPIELESPGERIAFFLADTNTRMLLCQGDEINQVSQVPGVSEFSEIIDINKIVKDSETSLTPITSFSQTPQPGPANLAYVIYTSGSTGFPKAVMVAHKNVVRLVKNTDYVELSEETRLLQTGAPGFDATTFEIWGVLLQGGRLYVAPNDLVLDVHWLAQALKTHHINTLWLTASLFNQLVQQNAAMFSGLEWLLVGGEVLSPQHINLTRRKNKKLNIVNGYGPTENTTFSTTYRIDREFRDNIPIGKPICNSTAYIMDLYNHLQPIGVTGELWVGGEGVSRGYLNNPELTAEKFDHDLWDYHDYHDEKNKSFCGESRGPRGAGSLKWQSAFPHPLCAMHHAQCSRPLVAEGKKIYKTGDLARWLEDGNIEFLGRIDFQVKIRGFRIELEEIQNHLLRTGKIKETVVLAKEDKKGDKYLAAYIVPKTEYQSLLHQVREELTNVLPGYMVPSYFIRLERIPLTPNGKIDRKALPEPGIKTGKDYIPPQNEIQERLVEIWSHILGIQKEKISIDHHFFKIGGHSLKATSLISRIHRAFNIKLKLTEVFKRPTIRQLSQYIKSAVKEQYRSIEAVEKKEYYKLSSAQERLYYLQRLDPGGSAYNIPAAWILKGNADKNRLESIYQKLIRKHESLRTSFEIVGKEPVQRVHDEVVFEIECGDLAPDEENYKLQNTKYKQIPNHKSQITNKEELFGQINAFGGIDGTGNTKGIESAASTIKNFVRPFDLSYAPLLRLGLVELKNEKYLLMIDMHHIVSDGTSMEILAREFMALYAGESLSPLKLQYKDYSQWRSSAHQKESIKKQESYWLKVLGGELPVLELPTDYIRPNVYSFAGGSRDFEMDTQETDLLKKLALEKDTTLFTLLLALYNIFLFKITGCEDIMVGTPTAGRRHGDLAPIVGMFVNTLAIRQFPQGEKKIDLFLEEVNKTTLEAFENQEYLFEDLVKHEELNINRNTSRNPLFDTMMVLQNMEIPAIKIPGLELAPLTLESQAAKFDISLIAEEIDGKLHFTFEYRTHLFKKVTIERFIKYFHKIVSAALASPALKLAEIEILPVEEKRQLLVDFNDTAVPYPEDKTIRQLFAEMVEGFPDHTGLIALGTTKQTIHVTYRELNEKSNQLAGVLIEKGVQPGNIVGIMVDRSIEMIISLLAITKAGGAYLPIEPAYPEERKKYMLDDSRARLLLSNVDHFNCQLSIVNCQLSMNDRTTPGIVFSTPQPAARNSQLAYIIYTSGSTGKPKGVMVEHGNVTRLVKNTNFINAGPGERLLLTGALVFDITTFETWYPLLNGLTLFLTDQEVILNAEKLANLIVKTNISILHLIPQLFSQLASRRLDIFKGLRYFLVGGDRVPPDYINRLRTAYPGLKILHMYGPTENTTFSTFFPVDKEYPMTIPIGKPVSNSSVYILSPHDTLQPIGIPGELCTAGPGVARGYLNNPELTAQKFDQDLWDYQDYQDKNKKIPGKNYTHHSTTHHSPLTIYHTGDLARWLPDGNIEFLGRIDHQVKVRGFRIEPGEIENRLLAHDSIQQAVVISKEDKDAGYVLCAYIVTEKVLSVPELREYLAGQLPEYMIPSYFMRLSEIPLTTTGKVDRRCLLTLATNETALGTGVKYVSPQNHIEKKLLETWSELLGKSPGSIGINDNFFDLGGHSLLLTRLQDWLVKNFQKDIPMITLFNHPTIASLARYLTGKEKQDSIPGVKVTEVKETKESGKNKVAIAVIGMACRFPGARNCQEFRNNLKNGIESISFLSDGELEELGVDPGFMNAPHYVPVKGRLEDKLYFDSFFFGYTPAEAGIMDPQVRVFHECVWDALENAGYAPDTDDNIVGLYAGATSNPFWEVLPLRGAGGAGSYAEHWNAVQFSDKDHLSTRIAYKLDLRGPAVSLQTACSTSLAAVDQACRGLLSGACDMALAGGVSVTLHDEGGYLYQEGTILSPEGHCRSFDARASGTVGGNGAGVVVLKPLEKALKDGDTIYAVIKGFALNNDGKNRVGYTAPSAEGQAKAIAAALRMAEIHPETITCIENHGTGTPLGDPIEIQGLNQAFHTSGAGKKNYCALGCVKTNIGHLDAAAGIAGLIKIVLALHHGFIPPSLHFQQANPAFDLENSPFYVNTELKSWQCNGYPRRAGVSSFGLGGTNVHVVLEEAPRETTETTGLAPLHVESASTRYQLILLSAKTPTALDKMSENLAEYFKKNLLNCGNHRDPTNPGPTLADAAYTLHVGRAALPWRRMMICSHSEEAIRKLENPGAPAGAAKQEKPTVIFMFSGQGSQYVNMGRDLYRQEPIFQTQVDTCFQILENITGINMKPVLFPDQQEETEAEKKIYQFLYTTPIKFIFEYSLARLLITWGIQPDAMIGHSFGEYVAACLAGVFSLEDGLFLAALRGELMHQLPPGAMLSVPLSEEDLKPLLPQDISLAAVNGESLCVVSGPVNAIEAFEKQLNQKGHECIRFRVPKAGHSHMVEPIMEEFRKKISRVTFKQPRIPFISGMSGEWVTPPQVMSTAYWTRHLRETVRFAHGLTTLLKEPNPLFLQVGPGRGLTLFVNQHPGKKVDTPTFNLVRQKKEEISDVYYTLTQIGYLWQYGLDIHGRAFYAGKDRKRIPLPTYPFEGNYYPADKNLFKLDAPGIPGAAVSTAAPVMRKKADIGEWFYVPAWEPKMPDHTAVGPADTAQEHLQSPVLIFMDQYGLGLQLKEQLEQQGLEVIALQQGVSANPCCAQDYDEWLKQLMKQGKVLSRVYHLWGIGAGDRQESPRQKIDKALAEGFYSVFFLVQALGKQCMEVSPEIDLQVVTSHVHEVTGEEQLCPENAPVYGLCKVIPQEYPGIRCRCIDVPLPPRDDSEDQGQWRQELVSELCSYGKEEGNPVVAYRGRSRRVQVFKPKRLEKPLPDKLPLKQGGVYLITGGTGFIGLTLARHLAKSYKAKLILIGRTVFPPRETWDQLLSTRSAGSPDKTMIRKIRELKEIEEIGTGVLVLTADVSQPQQMHAAFKQAEEKFGTINGVIHSAGMVSDQAYVAIRDMEKTGPEMHFRPKIYGLLVLEEILKDRPVDFCMVMSSTSAILGGLGLGAYSAANCFMDAYIHALNRSPGACSRWLSVNWDGWLREEQQSRDTSPGSIIRQLAMTPAQGAESFERILAGEGIKQVIQCSGDLQIRVNQWLNRGRFQAGEEHAPAAPASSRQPRPALDTPYEAPANPVEQTLANMWEELLGYDRVGRGDGFFQLGGDSLKAVIVTSKIHKIFSIKISLKEFFAAPTIAALARCITGAAKGGFYSIEPVEKKDYYTLSSTQKRMFILHQLEKNDLSYNIHSLVTLEGDIKKDRLEDIFRQLIHRHEILRTSFHLVSGKPVQRAHEAVEFKIECYDLAREADKEKAIIKNFIRAFALSRAPLLRVGLIALKEKKHLMMVDMHHIVSDGTSIGLLIKEFMGLYQGKTLSPLALQYKDYADWQQREWGGDRFKRQQDYWLQTLAGEVPVLNLPYDFDPPAALNFEGRQLWFELPVDETKALKELAAAEDVTLYMVLLSAYMILLSKISGQEDVVIGAPVAGRDHADVQGIIGMFVNTLVLRGFPVLEKGYRHLLMELKNLVLAAFENQDYPFEDLVEQKGLSGELERNPLFDAAFVLQNMDVPGMEIPGLKLKPYDIDNRWSNFDLTLMAEEIGQTIRCAFEYKTTRFSHETIERLNRYFRKVIDGVVVNPGQRIGQIEILSQAEYRQILLEFNHSETVPIKDKLLHQLFARQVEQSPDNTAVIGMPHGEPHPAKGEETRFIASDPGRHHVHLTYSRLDRCADQLAGLLIEKGVTADTIVGIMLERSLEMIIGILGILKAGGAYLPIDPANPGERVNYILADSSAGVLLTYPGLTGKLSMVNCQLLMVNEKPSAGQRHPRLSPWVNAPVTCLAYVIYTSGSAGKPKGVMVDHGSVTRLVKNTNFIDAGPGERLLLTGALVFDITTFEIWYPLLNGLTLFLTDQEVILNAGKLEKFIVKANISLLHLIPQLFIQLASARLDIFKGLRYFLVGGDWVRPEYINRLRTAYPSLKILHMYGPTENTTFSTFFPVDKEYPVTIPIGKPVSNTTVYILSRYGGLQPIGVPGELCVGGPGVARGYLNRPGLTAEKFLYSRFYRSYMSYRSYISKKIYKTGDLGQWLADGNIRFLGRIDFQVKIRGYRIELEEIRSALTQHRQIKEAVVVDRLEEDGHRYLCAYWVPAKPLLADETVDLTISELRAFLSVKLPSYMIPSYFVPLETIPLTSSGKIDRKALPDPDKLNIKLDSSYVEPVEELDLLLARIWKEVLKIDRVGIHDNFFDIGGNSIKILQVNQRLNETLNVSVPVVNLFQYPTISSLKGYLRDQGSPGGSPLAAEAEQDRWHREQQGRLLTDIAVIGVSGRFPGAKNIHQFWENLEKGIESISFFTSHELEEAGVSRQLLQDPNYVKACGILEDKDQFDAAFFNYTRQEVQVMDPQIRIFHECVWEALEDAGYNPETYHKPIGLYTGASNNLGWEVLAHLLARDEMMNSFQAVQLTNSHFIPNWISYKLDLKGPAVYVSTACSTSLTAIHTAYNALLTGDCALALAGGVSLKVEEKAGYLYQEGVVLSPDGHCRAFDNSAKGTVGGEGAVAVLLKPLEQAVQDGDHVYAVIKSSAMNNDGSQRVGFSAPSVDGQAEAISRVFRRAGIPPESITFVETHGTGTILGDPIEIKALKQAFNTREKGFCAIGSVKSNIGHLDSAGGAAGFVKVALALKHKKIPPTLHFEIPNRQLDLVDSPFYVNTFLRHWEPGAYPLRAGVSSFGIGGTNVHMVLEEAPEGTGGLAPVDTAQPSQQYQLILLSAKTQSALDLAAKNLAEYLRKNPGIDLADLAYTLQIGRKTFNYRWMTVCSTLQEAAAALAEPQVGTEKPGPATDSEAQSLRQIGQSWLKGREIDWMAFYRGKKRYRLSLPTYPFEGQRYWIKGDPWQIKDLQQESPKPQPARKEDIADWFYVPRWTPFTPVMTHQDKKESRCFLLFINKHPLVLQLVQRLRSAGTGEGENHVVVIVAKGNAFKKAGDHEFLINPHNKDDYRKLFTELNRMRVFPNCIVHTWNVTGADEQFEPGVIGPGFYSLVYLAAVIGEQDFSGEIRIDMVSTGLQEVIGNEPIVPEKAVILGPLKVIPQEYPYIICRSIDIELPPAGSSRESILTDYLVHEFLTGVEGNPGFSGSDIAYRNQYRWVKGYEPVRLEAPPGEIPVLRDRGVYLITGGCGGIGYVLAQYLVKRVRARLVLTGRSALVPGEASDPKMMKINHLEAAGAEVLYFAADAADKRRMAEVVEKAEEAFAPINGVIHAAGTTTGKSVACPVEEVGEAECQDQFRPKIQGTLVLAKLFRDRALDFCLLTSSLSPILGGLGFCAYSAANAFMDAFSFQTNRSGSTRWLSVNWADWNFPQQRNISLVLGASVTESLITPEEGTETFQRILTLVPSPVQQVIVSAGDLQTRIQQWVNLESLRTAKSDFPEPADTTGTPGQFYARPHLTTAYIAPRTPVEQTIAHVWQQQFGFEKIGIRDDFFELGGDSLKAISMISRIHKDLQTRVRLNDFFARPDIESLAQYITAAEKGEYASVPPVEKREYYVLSPAQKRLYLLDRMENLGTSYNMPLAIVLTGEPDRERLREVFAALIQRHESFRTCFKMLEDQPVQVVHQEVEFEIQYFGIHEIHEKVYLATEDTENTEGVAPPTYYCSRNTQMPDEKFWNENKVLQHSNTEGTACSPQPEIALISSFIRPFDLSGAPLLRVGLIYLEKQRHILVVEMHHIITDGISHQVLVRDFMALYEQKPLPPLSLQYKDYAQWQSSTQQRESVNQQEEFWLKQLQGEIPVLDLPLDYARPVVRGFTGGAVNGELSGEQLNRLKEIARSQGATLFIVLLAVYNIFLAKISGQEDILVGTPTAGRRHANLETIIGMFVNTLVLRNYPLSRETFDRFLRQVKQQTLPAFENQDYPFEELVEKVVKERDTSRNPLFDTAFVLQSQVSGDLPLPGSGETTMGDLTIKPLELEKNASPFDLILEMIELEEKIHFSLQYCDKLFARETIRRFTGYLKQLISSVIENPGVRICEIDMIPGEEKQRLLHEFNQADMEFPREKTLHGLFTEQAEQNPDRIALVGPKLQNTNYKIQTNSKSQNTNYKQIDVLRADVNAFAEGHLSYNELNDRSNQLAHVLIEKGVQPDTIVGIMLDRCVEMIIGLLGILKAGGAYLPIDPGYPEERKQYMLADSKARILLTLSNHSSWFFSTPEAFKTCPKGTSSRLHLSSAPATSLAYTIYTSGTTGKSKGTLTTHRNVIRVVKNTNYIELKNSDRILQLSNYAFDGSTFDIYGALLNGALLVMIKKEDVLNGERLSRIIAYEQITVFFLTTALFNTIVDINPDCLSGVRKVLFGGEQISVPHTRRALDHLGKNRIIHVYGPTETTVYATYYFINTIDETRETIPIGQPIANTTAYILDKSFCPVPLGVSGELFIGGHGLARGYLNQPELTAEKFCLRRPGGESITQSAERTAFGAKHAAFLGSPRRGAPGPPRKNFL
ncbi:MAG: amino acid adenylation domain-containing protein, partial [Candidatus Aminicenantes bacterium]